MVKAYSEYFPTDMYSLWQHVSGSMRSQPLSITLQCLALARTGYWSLLLSDSKSDVIAVDRNIRDSSINCASMVGCDCFDLGSTN